VSKETDSEGKTMRTTTPILTTDDDNQDGEKRMTRTTITNNGAPTPMLMSDCLSGGRQVHQGCTMTRGAYAWAEMTTTMHYQQQAGVNGGEQIGSDDRVREKGGQNDDGEGENKTMTMREENNMRTAMRGGGKL
jgi:hypothetical protein